VYSFSDNPPGTRDDEERRERERKDPKKEKRGQERQ